VLLSAIRDWDQGLWYIYSEPGREQYPVLFHVEQERGIQTGWIVYLGKALIGCGE
jgi:hypothetical protein